MQIVLILFIVALSYVLGSVSLSILMSKKLFGSDVRDMGSGNAGATNMARVFGMSAGALTLLADAVKAAVSMIVGYLLMGDLGLAIAGIACIIGHCYPAFYGFKGGKGVSVGVAIAYAVSWKVGLVCTVIFFACFFISRRVSLCSCSAALGISIFSLIFGLSTPRLVLAVVAMCLVIYRHKENIRRLIAGTEPEFKPGSRKDKYN